MKLPSLFLITITSFVTQPTSAANPLFEEYLITLSCIPTTCERLTFDPLTKRSTQSSCMATASEVEVFFPRDGKNYSRTYDEKTVRHSLNIQASETTVTFMRVINIPPHKTLVSSVNVNRMDGSFTQETKDVSQLATSNSILKGTCIESSELSKRKF